MNHFFFDVSDESGTTRDDVGLMLPDRETARDAALKALAEIAHDLLVTVGAGQLSIEVREESGSTFFRANSLTGSAWVN